MTGPDFYAAAERRIEKLTLILGSVGTLFAGFRWGWRAGAGVGVGAALMWLNFRWLKLGVDGLVTLSTAQAGAEKPRVPRTVYVKFLGRLVLLLFVVYVILSRSLLPIRALFAGLFTLVAAIVVEMLYELARGGHGSETHL